ncbi:MAG: hypothetical protein ACI9FJ_000060, partial [Alteromonadaceae bacterium]
MSIKNHPLITTVTRTLQPFMIVLFSTFILAACGGGSGSDGTPAPVKIGANLTLTISDGQNQQASEFAAASTIKLTVQAKNDFGRGASGIAVTFATTSGSLSQSTALTDSNGFASASLITTSNSVGVATITTTATVDGAALSEAKSIEITEQIVASNTLTLEVLDSACQTPVNSITAGNTLCLKARLSLDDVGVSGEVVTFTAPLGTLRQQTALTNASGEATVLFDTIITDIGAATATASANSISGTQNYQLTQPQSQSNATLSLVILDATCSTPMNRAASGNSLCIQASLVQNNQPLSDALITFAASLGTLQQTTALTNAIGVATVVLNSTNNILGAASASVTFEQVTTRQNYEFTSGTPQDTTTITLSVLDANCAAQVTDITAGNTFCLQASLIKSNQPLSNQVVDFSVTSGTLRPASALTNSAGVVSVFVDSTTNLLGAGVATATFGTFNAAKNYQYTDGTPQQGSETLSLSILDTSCNAPVSSAPAGITLCLQASLIKDNQPQIGTIVSFATTLGNLRQNSALTNAAGVVTVFLDSTIDLLAAGIVTASTSQLSASQNFEYTSSAPQGPTDISLTILDSSCTTPTNSITAGSTLCLQAILLAAQTPIEGEVITFAAPIGTLRQQTALTNSAGIASVLLDSADTLLGAATANAVFSTLSGSANYEFTSQNSQPSLEPQITLMTVQNGELKNRFKVGENIQLQAVLKDGNGAALNNVIIRFTAERGQLATTSALTDNNGQAQVTLTAQAVDLGAAVATAQVTINDVTFTKTFNYEILSADAVELDAARIGHFNAQNQFIENELGLTLELDENGEFALSAGGTMGVTIAVVDQDSKRITTPTPVIFNSACAANGNVNLDSPVSTINGEASSTYEDISCATVNGNQDTIVATITVNNVALSASKTIQLKPEAVGSIEFVSAVPTELVLQGTGGQGKQESSTLTFLVKGALGNPLAQQKVNFSLDASPGGLSLAPAESLTNSQGLVTTRVTSGTAPTVVRVTATTAVSDDNTIRTQSDLLSVNTGLPDQNSMTLSTATINPEANNWTGVEVLVTAYLADSFNNPVPDGTTVNFTTEGGDIQGTCNTTNGSCSVTWKGTNPRVINHRITVTAFAIGHETFFDTNGNNVFDDADGDTFIHDGTDSGLDRGVYHNSGFIDHRET